MRHLSAITHGNIGFAHPIHTGKPADSFMGTQAFAVVDFDKES